MTVFVVLIIHKRRRAPPHTDLPFTNNILTFSFACFCRHCPIRIRHSHRLSADFDLFFFFCLLTVSQLLFFLYCEDLFVSYSFLPRLSCIAISIPEYYFLGSIADRFGMSHPVCLIPSTPYVSSSPTLSADAPPLLLSV